MLEKRRSVRMATELELSVSSLFKQDNDSIEINSPIIVTDVSKSGIGFTSKNFFPVGYYFNACLKLGDQDSKLYSVVKIIRSQTDTDKPELCHYGCEFVGMAPVLDFIFEDYAKSLEEDK